jgi:hypothetical protein
MSFVLAAPAALVTAAADLAGIGSTLNTANAVAAAPTIDVPAAAADEVSAQVAALFSKHGLGYQQLSTQVAAFHEQFVQTLTAGASTYAAAESNAVQTLANTVNAPAAMVLGHPLIGSGAGAGASSAAAGGIFSNLLGGFGPAASQASALLLRPTGMATALAAANPLLQVNGIANALATQAALGLGSIGNAIENAYLAIEPWVQYGVNLAAYAAGFVIGGLAPQINFFYYLFEPIVQSALFNTLDWLGGTITFSQGLSNFWAATTASINQFITTEINWVRGFLPPLPPLP